MLVFCSGNMFKSNCKIITNATNCVGVMGGGLAALFINDPSYTDVCVEYNEYCQKVNSYPGPYNLLQPKIYKNSKGKDVLQFPTKIHWKDPSKIEYIEKGLEKILKILEGYDSVAFPKLGCGLGGLDWSVVKPLMKHHLKHFQGTVEIYE